MKIIGLTGSIGSGKSTVSGYLKELGAAVIDADIIGHQVLKDDQVMHELIDAFGNRILDENDQVSRKKLGDIVFYQDKKLLPILNRITHPVIFDSIKEELESYRHQGVRVTIIEAPLLLEAGYTSLVDQIWVTNAPEEIIIKRLKDKNGLPYSQIINRIHSQLPAEERNRYADIIIDTNVTFKELKDKVNDLWQGLTRLQKHY